MLVCHSELVSESRVRRSAWILKPVQDDRFLFCHSELVSESMVCRNAWILKPVQDDKVGSG